ncbi:adaptor protein complex 1 mu subunit [Anaeramoeba ignava]|uniref:Adaptor protein complex 1 mu subunit n=1 Tax=Anaeramoeba ignava TaxID=1746090 RepID=A0A9Q0R9R9_ANAIG|nr:adaptor protein complex 1 mu subunit [Anaeramoeba ignava]|eukprot:Anaeramoba_ignava/a219047_59.p2 GENE.a219047_59~~a219047_59.p2  ORF type:complete len:438 (-),score=140.85 a219047_59:1926-3239(-)
MACSGILIINPKGTILISRIYRGEFSIIKIKNFFNKIREQENESEKKPIIEDQEGTSYIFITHNSLDFVGIAKTTTNLNVGIIIEFLYKTIQVFQDYFQIVNEESITDNYVLIHQLLDEMMDFGYPQLSESSLLKEYISSEANQFVESNQKNSITTVLTSAVSWRSGNAIFKKNEVYVDVSEKLQMTISSTGRVINSEIIGSIKMFPRLTGNPTVHLGLNDKIRLSETLNSTTEKSKANPQIEFDDLKFHPCVRLKEFESSRTITFIPPDIKFELMSYRISGKVKPPFLVETMVEKHPGSRIEYLIKVKSMFNEKWEAKKVLVIIPVSEFADSPKIKTSRGKCDYRPDLNCLIWFFKIFQGKKEYTLKAHFGLSSFSKDTKTKNEKQPITIQFGMPNHILSGIRVEFLKIYEKSNYESFSWVRYITYSPEKFYEIRF